MSHSDILNRPKMVQVLTARHETTCGGLLTSALHRLIAHPSVLAQA